MKRNNLILLFWAFCFSGLPAFAQISNDDESFDLRLVPPSSQVSSLEQFIDVPVDYSSGIPNVSIPVCEVKGRQLSLPISISYHNNGLKVAQEADFLGLGWVLNSGGVISAGAHLAQHNA